MPNHFTIEDIARAANVSVSTVSRILNNKPDVAESTRQRVLQVIDEVGYEPHAQARSLAAGKGRMIAILFPPGDGQVSQPELGFFTSAAQAARKSGFHINLITDLFTENGLLNVYRTGQMDGIILTQIHMHDWRVQLLRENNYPFVMIGRCADNEGLSFVDIDSEEAILVAYEHLIELGHRRIGFINYRNVAPLNGAEDYGPTIRSLHGFQRACQRYQLEPYHRDADPTIADLYRATMELLDEQPGLTAVVSRHGPATVGAIRALRDRGRQVPGDCSVVGVTIDSLAEIITPPLTAISFPAEEMGYLAARVLIEQLTGTSLQPEQILLKPNIIVRESTGPVPVV
jgi:DNA-binding LacI/PurR family transcriptional regulator